MEARWFKHLRGATSRAASRIRSEPEHEVAPKARWRAVFRQANILRGNIASKIACLLLFIGLGYLSGPITIWSAANVDVAENRETIAYLALFTGALTYLPGFILTAKLVLGLSWSRKIGQVFKVYSAGDGGVRNDEATEVHG